MSVVAGSPIAETAYNVKDNVQFLLIPLPDKVFVPAEKAEVFAWDLLDIYAASWASLQGNTPNTWEPQ